MNALTAIKRSGLGSELWAWIGSMWILSIGTALVKLPMMMSLINRSNDSGSEPSSHITNQRRRFDGARVLLRGQVRTQFSTLTNREGCRNQRVPLRLCSCVCAGLVCSKYFPSRGVNGEELPASGVLRWNVCQYSSCNALDFHWMHPSTRRTEVSLSLSCWLWSLAWNLGSLFPLTQNTCATH